MSKEVWHASVAFEASHAFDEDAPFDVSDALLDLAGVLSVNRGLTAGRIAVTVNAESAVDAFAVATQRAREALSSSEMRDASGAV